MSANLGFIALIPLMFYLGLMIFFLYFLFRILRFLDQKTANDERLVKKLDQLIELQHQQKPTGDPKEE